MTGVSRSKGGVVIRLSAVEAAMLHRLATQLPSVLAGGRQDPAVARLLPEAYADDPTAAEEFRRYTESGLVERKRSGADALAGAIERHRGSDGERDIAVELDRGATLEWMRTITDIRLVLATRLGIERDGDVGAGDPELLDVYDWLAYVLESLVDAIEERS